MTLNYIRDLYRPKAVSLSEVRWTRYFPKPMSTALSKIDSSHYILCPVYRNGAIQLGVTGSMSRGSTPLKTMYRELAEEIGLVPLSSHSLTQTYTGKYPTESGGVKSISVYTARISDLRPVTSLEHNKKNHDPDDRSRKVGCMVHGTKDQVLKFLNKSDIYRLHSDDQIMAIAAISAKEAKEFASTL